MTTGRPPHYERVRAVLAALDAPVVELWGWPGTGKRAILQGVLEDEVGAEFLPSTWLAEPGRLEDRLRRQVGRRSALLVAQDTGPPGALAALAGLLRPGQRLLLATERRIEVGAGSLATSPDQLLLRPEEIGALWERASGRVLGAAECEWLHRRTSGWHLPLAVWARDPAIADAPIDDEARLPVRPIEPFLRQRVLQALEPGEIDVLTELARCGPIAWRSFVAGDDGDRRRSVLGTLRDRIGMPVLDDGLLVLPEPLAELLLSDAAQPEPRPLAAAIGDARAGRRSPVARFGSEGARARGGNPEADVRIGLLGGPCVERRDPEAGWVEVAWSFKRPLRILAYLASAPDLQASREEIVSIMWPEASEEAIRRNLHPAVSWLRRSVWPGAAQGTVVLLRDGVYSLDPALRWEVDVHRFLACIDDGATHHARGRVEDARSSWEEAWRMYRGAFLSGWTDRWVLAQRDELQLRFTDLLRRLGDLEAKLGRLTQAEDAYRTVLLEDPLEEGVHVSIMRIYAARGRRDLVNRQYQRLRTVLLEELGVEPSLPTLEVFNELMAAPQPLAYR